MNVPPWEATAPVIDRRIQLSDNPVASPTTPIAPATNTFTGNTLGVIQITGIKEPFYINRHTAEAALELLKDLAIMSEDVESDQEVWCVEGV